MKIGINGTHEGAIRSKPLLKKGNFLEGLYPHIYGGKLKTLFLKTNPTRKSKNGSWQCDGWAGGVLLL